MRTYVCSTFFPLGQLLPLDFEIYGGQDEKSIDGDTGIFIKEIKEGSSLSKDVKVGDKIVKVRCILVSDHTSLVRPYPLFQPLCRQRFGFLNSSSLLIVLKCKMLFQDFIELSSLPLNLRFDPQVNGIDVTNVPQHAFFNLLRGADKVVKMQIAKTSVAKVSRNFLFLMEHT